MAIEVEELEPWMDIRAKINDHEARLVATVEAAVDDQWSWTSGEGLHSELPDGSVATWLLVFEKMNDRWGFHVEEEVSFVPEEDLVVVGPARRLVDSGAVALAFFGRRIEEYTHAIEVAARGSATHETPC